MLHIVSCRAVYLCLSQICTETLRIIIYNFFFLLIIIRMIDYMWLCKYMFFNLYISFA